MKSKFDPHLSSCWVERYDIGVGLWLYVAFTRKFVGPIGVVWGIPIGSTPARFDVLHSYVLPFARRKGVRTLIQKEILKSFDVITTVEGSREGGAAFMKAAGYKHDPARAMWSLVKPRKRGRAR